MDISIKDWNKYISRLRDINQKAAQLMSEYIESHGIVNAKQLIKYAYALTTKYGEAATELACQMYDAVSDAQKAFVVAAEPAATATYNEIENAIMEKIEYPAMLSGVTGRFVKQAAADTTIKNVKRDKAEWAWIPSGDTCAYCLALASKGWQPASSEMIKGNHAQHIHPNCDCNFAVRFNSKSNIEGYDPNRLYDTYNQAEGQSAKDKINYLRRKNYGKNKDKINEQKRAAYAKRTEISLPKQLEFSYNGHKKFIPKGTVIESSKTIAGKGSKVELRDAKRLVSFYGGNENEWKKRVGKISSDKYIFDIHWYEKDGVRFEEKISFIKERNT